MAAEGKNFIGKRLAVILATKNISERQLGERLGCSNSYINKIVNGRVVPPIRKIQSICDVLDITLAKFFESTELTFMQQRILGELEYLTDEDIQFILTTILYIKKKNEHYQKKAE